VKDAPTLSDNFEAEAQKRRRMLPGLTVKDGLIRHPFDLEFGTRTSGLVAGRHLQSRHREGRDATAYYAVAPSVFHALIARWKRTMPPAPINSYAFIDLGAGMGRAILLAAEYPFRSVVGVEMHPTLARIARRNMALWRAQSRADAPMRMLCRNAVGFPLPPGPCLFFLFNPFGAPVLRRVLRSWRSVMRGRTASIDVLYVNNEQDHVLEMEPGFARLFSGRVRRSPADTAADRTILTSQPDAEYSAMPWEDCSIHRWLGNRDA
jgi:SAM-dependent methyltransferase